MKRAEWQALFESTPPQLTLKALARRIGKNYRPTAAWARKLGYAKANANRLLWTAQRRREFSRLPWHLVPWHLSNSEIGRKYNVTREIVRRRRKEYGNHKPRSIEKGSGRGAGSTVLDCAPRKGE